MIGWIVSAVLSLLLASPALVFLTSVVAGLKASRSPRPQGGQQRLLFLVPAHDEEMLIAECVHSLIAMTYPADRRRIVVIADNCSDRTGDLARAGGAQVLERADPERRGKPAAIAWALRQLGEAYDSCVIIDADSVVEAGFAAAVNATGPLGEDAAQAYFATRNEDENWLTLLAGVLARAKYEVLYPVKARAGLNCPLTGNGMIFGAVPLVRDGWTAFSLAEDWELYADYTSRGRKIGYVRDARLRSQEVRSMGQGRTQRVRWIQGRRDTLGRFAGPIVRAPGIGILQKLDALLELTQPTPIVQGVCVVAAVIGAVTLFPRGPGLVLAAAALLSVGPLVAATSIVVLRHRRRAAVLAAMIRLPVYAVWRLAVSLEAAISKRSGWVRTARHDAKD